MAQINFVKENISISVNSGTNIRKIAKKNNVSIYRGLSKYFNCHGMGLCGTCVIHVPEGSDVSPKRRGEEKLLKKSGINGDNVRLACQCQVYGDVDVVTIGH